MTLSDPPPSKRDDAFRALWLLRTLERQGGVVSRAQLTSVGFTTLEVRRKIRRRELVQVHPRVYVDHNGPLTWRQRARAALLYAAPAALCWESVTEPARDEGAPIHLAIDKGRRIAPQPGIVVHRVTRLASHVFAGSDPPRLRLEDNALILAAAARTEVDAVAAVAAVVGRRGVTAAALETAFERFPKLRHRAFLRAVVGDLARGASSVLEHRYLVFVERAHGLPSARRQAPRRTPDGWQFRDAEYPHFGLVIEFDGRLGHDSWAGQGVDADRDLDDLARIGSTTIRLRWRQVFHSPCRTAARIAAVLARRGWQGTLARCGPTCDAQRWVERRGQ